MPFAFKQRIKDVYAIITRDTPMTMIGTLFNTMRIGLLGGSFNPPHQGHRAISLVALRKFALDQVWWLVTPGNPLKDPTTYAAFGARVKAATRCARHPKIKVSTFEADHNLLHTAHTLAHIQKRFARTQFLWLMGSDSLSSFHRWHDWRHIALRMPIGVFNRPSHHFAPLNSPAAIALEAYRLPQHCARNLVGRSTPAWVFLPQTDYPISSSQMRQANTQWQQHMVQRQPISSKTQIDHKAR